MERYALALSDAQRMLSRKTPLLDYQKWELRDAGSELNGARPRATRDLRSALRHEPVALRAMRDLHGQREAPSWPPLSAMRSGYGAIRRCEPIDL